MDEYLLLLLEKPITIQRIWIDITPTFNAALLLSQLWHYGVNAPNGIIIQTPKQQREDANLTEPQYQTAIKQLMDRGYVIEEGRDKSNRRQLSIDRKLIRNAIMDYLHGVTPEASKLPEAARLFDSPPLEQGETLLPLPEETTFYKPAVHKRTVKEINSTEDIANLQDAQRYVLKIYEKAWRIHIKAAPLRFPVAVFMRVTTLLKMQDVATGKPIYEPERLGNALASAFTCPDKWVSSVAHDVLKLLSDNRLALLWGYYLKQESAVEAPIKFSEGRRKL